MPHASAARRSFHRCRECSLIFAEPAQRPARHEERARYERHQNAVDDPGYLAHLAKLADAVTARTAEGASGLDYGSGPAPALALLLSRSGRPCAWYDPLFHADESLLARRYDFLTCSEVVEHVHEPRPLFERFSRLVRPGGLIGIMTGMTDDVPSFADWWYIRDITHVCFYSRATMEWIAREFAWTVEFPAPNVTLFSPDAGSAD